MALGVITGLTHAPGSNKQSSCESSLSAGYVSTAATCVWARSNVCRGISTRSDTFSVAAHPEQFADEQAWAAAYLEGFTEVMRRPPTRRGHTNVLQHLAGYISAHLDGDEREELTEMIDQYRLGFLPLIVPVTLIRHYGRKFHVSCLLDQVYLSPHPHELMLLNHL
jgi:hypothetical protein